MSIQNIKPYAPEGEDIQDWMFTLQTFNAGAGCADQFLYFPAGSSECDDGEGWYYDYDFSTKADYEFKPGEGFMFESYYGDESGAGFTVSGQVNLKEYKKNVNSGYTLIGNVRPVKISIQDMIPYAPEGEDIQDWMFTLQTFNAGAGCADQFLFFPAGSGECDDGEGWYYDYDFSTKADYEFNPGEGFMFESYYEDESGAGLKFKEIKLN